MTKTPSKRFLWELGSWGFIAPHLILFLVFMILPLFVNTVMSLFNWSLLGNRVFVGFNNFIRIWTDDKFWLCVKNTSLFALFSVPLVIIVGILFAMLLNQKIYGKLWILIGIVSQTFFGSIGILTTWKWIFASYPSGLANYVVMSLGIVNKPVSWFETSLRSWCVVAFVTVWWIVGFSVLLYQGAMQRIPPEQYEAAKVDGAGPVRRFFNITLPWMRDVLFFDVVRQVLLAFAIFDQMYIFTGGGPAGSTRTMVYYLFITGFQRQEMGRAAAISWYIFLVVLVFGLIQLFMTIKSIKGGED